ncbi:succinate dehydrogenase ubiquinone iron-sulfur subunit [Musa troglodytarum]|uniref:Succinate dehydrogenase ubiquinone iron-sulfur subunit n=1 Tax=Musa troglodytarum TaxID=320322 RepID=A0A9E7EH02_9LILI|nr:succinate dehydrogenase ubiquinone iron-sulfur subunit [Musa troglodytarum]
MLSSDPSRGDYIVTLIHYPYGGISFARSGDKKWTTMSLPGLYDDAIFYRDQFYATFDGRVDVWDDLDEEWKTVVPKPKWIQDSRDQYAKVHLNAVNDEFKPYHCHTIMNCARACPKGLNPAKQIESIKKLLLQ